MNRKPKKAVSFRLSEKAIKALQRIAEETGFTKTYLVECAIQEQTRELLDREAKR